MAYIIFKTPIRPSRNRLSHKASLKLLARGLLGILCFVIAADIAAHLFQGLLCVPDLQVQIFLVQKCAEGSSYISLTIYITRLTLIRLLTPYNDPSFMLMPMS